MYTANQTTYSNNVNAARVQHDAQSPTYPSSYQSQYPQQPPALMQPELLAYNGAYGYGGVNTPTNHCDWNQQSNSGAAVYAPSSPWTTTHTGGGNSFRGGGASSGLNSPAQQPLSQPDGGKKYRHNPYASSEPSNTPPQSPIMSASHSSNFGDYSAAGQDAAAPIYDPNVLMNGDSLHHMSSSHSMHSNNHHQNSHQQNQGGMHMQSLPSNNTNLEDQFASIQGSIAQTACTARGRTLLLNIIRMQHLDKIQIIFDELCLNFGIVIADPQGCHVLRFIVEYLQESHIDTLCAIMTPQLAYSMCTLSQHSRRVLQCLVEHHKTERLAPLVELICANGQAVAIARTQQGCIAIMRMLENVVVPLKDFIFQALAPSFAELAIDQFGNYTIQTAIQIMDRVTLNNTFEHVLGGKFVKVSCNKFGSNVMEKFLHCATSKLVDILLRELCFEPQNLHKLINDGFGNFVIQGLVEATAGTSEGRRLCDTIRPLLQYSPYGHKIEAKLRSKRLLGAMNNDSNVRSNSIQGASSSASTSSTCGQSDTQ